MHRDRVVCAVRVVAVAGQTHPNILTTTKKTFTIRHALRENGFETVEFHTVGLVDTIVDNKFAKGRKFVDAPTPTQLMTLTDDELMIRLQGGEKDPFDELVRRYQGPLFGFFLKNIRDAQQAEDLSQETLLRVYHQFWDYLPSGRFRGWMYRIARNLMIDNIRRQSHDALVRAVKGRADDENDTLARIAGELDSPDEVASHSELSALVDLVLEELPEEQRLTFTLHHYGGLTLPEVANVMETSVPTTKSRLRLAREKLKEKLAVRGVRNPHETDDSG